MKDKKKKKSVIDKVVMGAIVGGAIGSVVGMTVAPKEGKKTREYLAKKGKEIYDAGKEVADKIHETTKEKKGFFQKLLDIIRKK